MKKNLFLRLALVGLLAGSSVTMWADNLLPNQPVGKDGCYIVKWDCQKDTWAESNDMEFDETFVFAIDLTGTKLLSWLEGTPKTNMVRSVAVDKWLNREGNQYAENTARLWKIKGNIYGATFNFKQMPFNNGTSPQTPGKNVQSQIACRIFGIENGFGNDCGPSLVEGQSGNWWQYPGGWEEYTSSSGKNYLFALAPYTGTKTSEAFETADLTNKSSTYYDKDHYVENKGYASPCGNNTPAACCIIESLTVTCSEMEPIPNQKITLKAKCGYNDGNQKRFVWYCNGVEMTTIKEEGDGVSYSQITINAGDEKTNNGYYTYVCHVYEDGFDPSGCHEQDQVQIHVVKKLICPEFAWSLDKQKGLTTPMYPGGWYELRCSTPAGAPTITVSGTGVTTEVLPTEDDTVAVVRVTLQGNATGTISFKAVSPENVDKNYKSCTDEQSVETGNCETGLAYTMQGYEAGGKYVIDNNGKVEMGNASNKNNLWQPISTGEKVNGYDVFYLKNVGTGQYLYRGPVQFTNGNKGNLTPGNIDYAEPLTSINNEKSDAYKWFFYKEDRYIYVMCKADWNGNWQQAFVLHNRDWEYMFCQGGDNQKFDLRVCKPEMKVGKMDGFINNQMRMENDPYNTGNWQFKEVFEAPEHIQTTIGWSGAAPQDTVELSMGGTCTYTANRTDAIHSINKNFSYTSSDPTVATVDAATGKVTIVGSGTSTITAKLENVGCFDGGEISYVVKVKGCSDFTWAIDGNEGLTTPMYPGGWYMVSCTNEDGAPTITVTGTGITTETATTSGKTTTMKVILSGTATAGSEMQFNAQLNANGLNCHDEQLAEVGNCEGGEAVQFKWQDPGDRYIADQDGVVTLVSLPTDKSDLWYMLPTGETVSGASTYYLRNVKTGAYMYRGETVEAGEWDYAAALTSVKNGKTGDYKWFVFENGGNKFIVNVAGINSGEIGKSYVLHSRNTSDANTYCNTTRSVKVCAPAMVCGSMNNQTGDGHMRMNQMQTIEVPAAHFTTTVDWNGSAPEAKVEASMGDEMTYAIKRTDDVHSINATITYTSSNEEVATVDANGKVAVVGSGTTTITATLEDAGCFDGAEKTYDIHVKGCSEFVWEVDGVAADWEKGLMYPGGWYLVSCTTEDGAPDITVSGTGIIQEAVSKTGNTTTIKVILTGEAQPKTDITFTASLTTGAGLSCSDVQKLTISECTTSGVESRKIEWFNFKTSTQTWPEFWIHDGAPVFLRDNNGKLEADIEHSDGNDQWYIIKTGDKCQGQDVFYLQNVQTQRYVYRGSVHGNQGGDWEYAEALLSANNAGTNDYKWVLYAHDKDTAIVCIDGFTGTNLTNGAYVLHVRNWEAPNLFTNPSIPSPRMVCGKMANQGGSPAFYYKGYTITKPITRFQTEVEWDGT
ncbi:MAG: Ig-like domain-containing protein, partial [Paludibacteraceae bacterium]|nr:Ig-like domain-containing protein [Paludibacteraceae bacterium]